MCGRFTLTQTDEAIARSFKVNVLNILPSYNIAPSQAIAAILENDSDSQRELAFLRWGLIPSWAKDVKIGYNLINARSETVLEKPSFRSAFKHRRCLILADGFYEWQHSEDGKGQKQPYYFRMKDSEIFAFAGLWEVWESKEGDIIKSCTILTTAANQLLEPIHDRMPVILQPKDYDTWLDREDTKSDRLTSLLTPYSAEEMTAYPVSTKVNSPKNNSAECLYPLDLN